HHEIRREPVGKRFHRPRDHRANAPNQKAARANPGGPGPQDDRTILWGMDGGQSRTPAQRTFVGRRTALGRGRAWTGGDRHWSAGRRIRLTAGGSDPLRPAVPRTGKTSGIQSVAPNVRSFVRENAAYFRAL